MPKQSFMPRQEGPKVNWLNKLTDALMDPLKGYAAKYGISSANMTKLDNGRKAVNWVWGNLEKVRAFPQQFTTFKDALFDGEGALGTLPLAPALSTPPVAATLYADVFGFALLLATARRVTESEHFLRAGRWQRWASPAVTHSSDLSEIWLKSMQLLGNEPAQATLPDQGCSLVSSPE